MSVIILPYLWSSSSYFGVSSTFSGITNVSGLAFVLVDCNFSDSIASTQTIGTLVFPMVDLAGAV